MRFIVQASPNVLPPDRLVTLYQGDGFQGGNFSVGLGRYQLETLVTQGNRIGSIRTPEGLSVTLFPNRYFRGDRLIVSEDTASLGAPYSESTVSFVVELTANLYTGENYSGTRIPAAVGIYNTDGLFPAGTSLLSLKVPPGLRVVLYERIDLLGRFFVATQDTPAIEGLSQVRSLIVELATFDLPANSLTFGDVVWLKNGSSYLSVTEDGTPTVSEELGENEQFRIIRSGKTKNVHLLNSTDTISLQTVSGIYMEVGDRPPDPPSSEVPPGSQFVLVKAGPFLRSGSMVGSGETVRLESAGNGFLSLLPGSGAPILDPEGGEAEEELWALGLIEAAEAPSATRKFGSRAVARAVACGAETCGAAVCPAEACGAVACGAAGCAANACGGAACGGDACGAAACGADACGGAACMNDVGGVVACGAATCANDAGGVGACGADACGANACGINACPADACAADACAIDVIPIIPGI